MGLPEKKNEQGIENIFKETTTENSLNLGREVDIQVQETQWTPSKIKSNTITLRRIIIKMLNVILSSSIHAVTKGRSSFFD